MGSCEVVEIDGSLGEGGGQIVRSSVALAAVTGRPLRMIRVRGKRPKPGLRAQHVAALKAVAMVCGGRLEGARIESERFRFTPGALRAGRFEVKIPTAGSACLVLHAVLPAMMRAPGETEMVVFGGTHVPKAPSFEHFARVFLPALGEMGVRAEIELMQVGFQPKGGGAVRLRVWPWKEPQPFLRTEWPAEMTLKAVLRIIGLPEHVQSRSERFLQTAGYEVTDATESGLGPGFCALMQAGPSKAWALATVLGRRGMPAERILEDGVESVHRYLTAQTPVGMYLADQLLLPMALGRGGVFVTDSPTLHFETQVSTVERFLDCAFSKDRDREGLRVSCAPR